MTDMGKAKNKSGEYEIPVRIKGKPDAREDPREEKEPAPETTPEEPGQDREPEEPGQEEEQMKQQQDAPRETTPEEPVCKDEKIARLEEQVKRLSAEFENFRRRQEKRFEDSVKYAAETVVSEFLPVLDSIRMAHNTAQREQDFDQLLKGLDMIASQLNDTLNKLGVEQIDAVGQTFDPALHHAVQAEVTEDFPDEEIIEEYQKGYIYKDRVLRPSMVKVARTP